MTIQPGKITRIVHVCFADNMTVSKTNLDNCHGYAILQGADGREVFFVDSALQDANFTDLEIGCDVLYTLESGPLGRAARVWATTPQPSLCCIDHEPS